MRRSGVRIPLPPPNLPSRHSARRSLIRDCIQAIQSLRSTEEKRSSTRQLWRVQERLNTIESYEKQNIPRRLSRGHHFSSARGVGCGGEIKFALAVCCSGSEIGGVLRSSEGRRSTRSISRNGLGGGPNRE